MPEESVELLFLEYSSFQGNYFASNCKELIYNHFLFWMNHLAYLKVIYNNELMLYIFKQYQKYVPKLNDYYLTSKKINHDTAMYANAFTIGIFWSLLYI
ncbi:hypothetical protein GCM10026983_06880 [Gracilibacillus alcaliphilus]